MHSFSHKKWSVRYMRVYLVLTLVPVVCTASVYPTSTETVPKSSTPNLAGSRNVQMPAPKFKASAPMELEDPGSKNGMDVDDSNVQMDGSEKSKLDVDMEGSDDSSSDEDQQNSDGNNADDSGGGLDKDLDESVQPAPSSSPPRKKPTRRSIKSEADSARKIAFLRSQRAKGRTRNIKPKPTRPNVKPSARKKPVVKVEESEDNDNRGDETEDESECEMINKYKKMIISNHTRGIFLAMCDVEKVQDAENFELQYDDDKRPVYWKNKLPLSHLDRPFEEN
ncbi:hypothetical protein FRC12_015047 [Ceratobasidium sp. 428]|nr:hypothetical protein FRC12_015047 [Ceratobasidium sp. 428]